MLSFNALRYNLASKFILAHCLMLRSNCPNMRARSNPRTELVSYYKNEVQWADSKLQKLREELEIVSTWPD